MVTVGKSLLERKGKNKTEIISFTLMFICSILLLIIVLLNTFVFVNVEVSGDSMYPTLSSGDVLVANKYKKVSHGSIVVISGEKKNAWIIKRVIAMEGDTVKIGIDGYVYVKYSGEDEFTKLIEPYLTRQGVTGRLQWVEERTLSKGEIFYLGDNRGNSKDSRDEEYSTCNISQIVAVVENWSIKIKGFNRKINEWFS